MFRVVSSQIILQVCGFRIFTMQGAFALLESGVVRKQHATCVMIKNLGDIIFGTMAWWGMGYGLAFANVDAGAEPGTFFPSGESYFFPDVPNEAMW